jgi:hypothetical protein
MAHQLPQAAGGAAIDQNFLFFMGIEENVYAAAADQLFSSGPDKGFILVPLDQLSVLGCPMGTPSTGQKNRFDDIGLSLCIPACQ